MFLNAYSTVRSTLFGIMTEFENGEPVELNGLLSIGGGGREGHRGYLEKKPTASLCIGNTYLLEMYRYLKSGGDDQRTVPSWSLTLILKSQLVVSSLHQNVPVPAT